MRGETEQRLVHARAWISHSRPLAPVITITITIIIIIIIIIIPPFLRATQACIQVQSRETERHTRRRTLSAYAAYMRPRGPL